MIEFLIFGLLSLSVLCLWLLIEGRKNPKFLIWFIPILLVLTSSTYVTYTSILGNPKRELPEEGIYLKHYIDEPFWIYLWIVGENNIPKNFQIPYTKKGHSSLEKVEVKSEEGKFMMLGRQKNKNGAPSEDEENESSGGHTLGGDISFYEWKYETDMFQKE